jgi:hypothetical protein
VEDKIQPHKGMKKLIKKGKRKETKKIRKKRGT